MRKAGYDRGYIASGMHAKPEVEHKVYTVYILVVQYSLGFVLLCRV